MSEISSEKDRPMSVISWFHPSLCVLLTHSLTHTLCYSLSLFLTQSLTLSLPPPPPSLSLSCFHKSWGSFLEKEMKTWQDFLFLSSYPVTSSESLLDYILNKPTLRFLSFPESRSGYRKKSHSLQSGSSKEVRFRSSYHFLTLESFFNFLENVGTTIR